MKFLILALLVFVGCSRYIYEDTMYVTRKYCGTFDTLIVGRRDIRIVTSEDYFYIPGRIRIDVPKNARCYVKYLRESLPDTPGSYIWILYFTWDGTDDLYMIKQNFITGQILR